MIPSHLLIKAFSHVDVVIRSVGRLGLKLLMAWSARWLCTQTP